MSRIKKRMSNILLKAREVATVTDGIDIITNF